MFISAVIACGDRADVVVSVVTNNLVFDGPSAFGTYVANDTGRGTFSDNFSLFSGESIQKPLDGFSRLTCYEHVLLLWLRHLYIVGILNTKSSNTLFSCFESRMGFDHQSLVSVVLATPPPSQAQSGF